MTKADGKSLNLGFRWSAFGHFFLLALIILKGTVFRGEAMRYIPTLKVDLVALPDYLKNERINPGSKNRALNPEIANILKEAEDNAKRIAEKVHPAKENAKKDEMVLKPVHTTKTLENRNKRALERIKALTKIQDSTEDRPSEEAIQSRIIKGNKISPGTSLSGEAKEAAESNYLDVLRDRLKENWTLPAWIARQTSLEAQIRVHIDSHGKLRSFQFIKTSGNPQFDEAITKTLQDSQPFPFPPKELQSSLLSDGILVGFPL